MAKQRTLVGQAKFQVPGGAATPAPPVGTSLGKFGINLGQFVSQFNERTREYNGTPIPVIYCDACGMVPEKEENLPVVLPHDVQISGKGGSPLACHAAFVNAVCPLVKKVHHEVKVRAGKGYSIVYVGHEGHQEAIRRGTGTDAQRGP